jgi:hypothetical protein
MVVVGLTYNKKSPSFGKEGLIAQRWHWTFPRRHALSAPAMRSIDQASFFWFPDFRVILLAAAFPSL